MNLLGRFPKNERGKKLYKLKGIAFHQWHEPVRKSDFVAILPKYMRDTDKRVCVCARVNM